MSNKYCSMFVKKGVCSFRRFTCNRELILNCWRSYRESTLRLVLGTKSCLEMDDLRVLEIAKKCNKIN